VLGFVAGVDEPLGFTIVGRLQGLLFAGFSILDVVGTQPHHSTLAGIKCEGYNENPNESEPPAVSRVINNFHQFNEDRAGLREEP